MPPAPTDAANCEICGAAWPTGAESCGICGATSVARVATLTTPPVTTPTASAPSGVTPSLGTQSAGARPVPLGPGERVVDAAAPVAGSPSPPTRTIALLLAGVGIVLIVAGLAFSHLPSPLIDFVYQLNGEPSEAVVASSRRPTTTTSTTSRTFTRTGNRPGIGGQTEEAFESEPAVARQDPAELSFGPGRWILIGVLLCAVAATMWRRSAQPPERRDWLGPLCWGVGVVWASFVVATGVLEFWRRDQQEAWWFLTAIPVPRIWSRPFEAVAALTGSSRCSRR